MSGYDFIEYGVELTWPDGARATDAVDDVEMAEKRVAWHAANDSICTARIVYRTHVISGWRTP